MQYGGKDVGHFVKSPAIQRQHLDPHPHLGRLNNEVEIAWWLGTWESESATLTYKPGAGEDEENTPAVAGREGLVSWFNCCIFLYLIVQKITMHFTVDYILYWKKDRSILPRQRILDGTDRFALGERKGRNTICLVFYMLSLRMTHKHLKI